MKKLIMTLSLATLISFNASLDAKAAPEAATIGVIDFNLIMTDSKAAKSLNEQMTTLRSNYEKEIFKKEEALRKKEKELDKLTGSKLEKARSELEAEVAQFQKTIMLQQNQMQLAAQKAFEQVRQKVIGIASEVSKQEGYAFIQPSAAFLTFPPESDITKKAIELLDKELSSVKVELPKDESKS